MTEQMIQKKDQYEIFIVDDNQDNLECLSKILKKCNYRVRSAASERLALKSIFANLPDLILLNVKMPEMDGYEICRRLKFNSDCRSVPVIFISSYGQINIKAEGFKAGGIDYISRPFVREEVLARIQTHLRLQELTAGLERQVAQRTGKFKHDIIKRKQIEKEKNLQWMY